MPLSLRRSIHEYSIAVNFCDPSTKKKDTSFTRPLSKATIEENLWGASADAAVRSDTIDSLVCDDKQRQRRVYPCNCVQPCKGPP